MQNDEGFVSRRYYPIASRVIVQTGGSAGIRDLGLTESAIAKSRATFAGQDLYATLEEKIAATAYALVNNHGFIDGNKRIGIAAMLVLAKMNHVALRYTQKELIELGLGIAESKIQEKAIRDWLINHGN